MLVYSLVFFLVALWLCMTPGKLVNRIGHFLTPSLLVLLVFLGLAYSIMRFMLGLFDQGERLLNRGRHLRKRR